MPRKSTGAYPPNWKEIAQRVKDEAGWRCIRCAHAHEVKTGYMLTVHHADLDKGNVRWHNLLALCQRCHLKIQHKVIVERGWMFEHSEWFKPYVAGYYAFRAGLPDDKESVMENLEALLKLGMPQVGRAESE